MFTFFSKKKYLTDYLEGLVDMHNHILPGIDDGAKTVEDSIALIKGFGEFGVTHFVCTPHIMDNYYPNDPKTINASLEMIKNGLKMNGLEHVKIEAAAEHMIDANFELLLERNDVMPLKKQYLLVEMSYLQPSINFDEAIQKIAEHRFFPILAHPERYVYLKEGSSKYKKYKEKGILFQLNLLSLGTYYGKEVQHKALRLIEKGLIDYIASDIHNLNQLQNLKEIKIDSKLEKALVPIIRKTAYEFS